MTDDRVREQSRLYLFGENVTVEMTAEQRDHLKAVAAREGFGGISNLVQSLACCYAPGIHPRKSAEAAGMPYAKWLATVALDATGYVDEATRAGALRAGLMRARRAMKPYKEEA